MAEEEEVEKVLVAGMTAVAVGMVSIEPSASAASIRTPANGGKCGCQAWTTMETILTVILRAVPLLLWLLTVKSWLSLREATKVPQLRLLLHQTLTVAVALAVVVMGLQPMARIQVLHRLLKTVLQLGYQNDGNCSTLRLAILALGSAAR